MIERKFVCEYDLLVFLAESGGDASEQEMADHFGVELDKISSFMNRLMMMGYVARGGIGKTALGQAKVDQMEAELKDAGDIFSPEPDYRLCEESGYLYANGWKDEDGVNSPYHIAMMLAIYREELYG